MTCLPSATLAETLRAAAKTLQQAGLAEATLDARLLVEWITGTTRLDGITKPERTLSGTQLQQLEAALERRIAGEPAHRIIGERAFYGLDFTLSVETLEPRPDTETLVDLVLPFLHKRARQKQPITCLDMGTGSGALAIALLVQVPQLQAAGVDIAAGALATAQKNAEKAGVQNRFTPCESDWFRAVNGRFDLIVSNPPYIPHADIADLDASVRNFDPLRALDGGTDGLDFYRALAAEGQNFLAPQGKIAVEIGYEQKAAVTALFTAAGFTLEDCKADLGGIDRALLFS